MTKLENLNCDKTIVTKLNNSNYDLAQKFILWPNPETNFLTELKSLNCDKTELKFQPNLTIQIVKEKKIKKSKCDKTHNLKFWQLKN